MKIEFHKYNGAGNDFIMIDNRKAEFNKSPEFIARLCHRNFGIGADGLIVLENDTNYDFRMFYYNADGNESSMCGNGGRCIVGFAHQLGIIKNETTFIATDGLHYATINEQKVSLQMIDVNDVIIYDEYSFLDTGSPHHVEIVDELEGFDVYNQGKKIRNDLYGVNGSNINFVQLINNNTFRIRTYERGVENETLACGTGAAAVALSMYKTKKTIDRNIDIITQGGTLNVSFIEKDSCFKEIILTGDYKYVFSGTIDTINI